MVGFACSAMSASRSADEIVAILSHDGKMVFTMSDEWAPLRLANGSAVGGLERRRLSPLRGRAHPPGRRSARARSRRARSTRIVDLGCGPGNSTELLRRPLPASGDRRPRFLRRHARDGARASAAREISSRPTSPMARTPPFDLIFANAVLQWVPDHIGVMARLIAELAPRGCLAVQMPDNLDEPTHALMREIAATGARSATSSPARRRRASRSARSPIMTTALSPVCDEIDVWRTTYVHRLAVPTRSSPGSRARDCGRSSLRSRR